MRVLGVQAQDPILRERVPEEEVVTTFMQQPMLTDTQESTTGIPDVSAGNCITRWCLKTVTLTGAECIIRELEHGAMQIEIKQMEGDLVRLVFRKPRNDRWQPGKKSSLL